MPRSHSCVRVIALVVLSILIVPAFAAAQSYVYVNNQDAVNTVSAFSVAPNGILTVVPGSPFATAGAGSRTTCYGLDRMVVSTADKLMFVSNSGDQTISVLQIDSTSGALTLAPGSPAASGLTLDSCGGISLAVTPDGKFLMASSNGQIQSFNIAADGSLTPAFLTTNCCVPNVGMKISADGRLLALSNETSLSMYLINPDGSLTAVAGSPFPKLSSGLVSGLEFSCAADRLYASEANLGISAITDAWSVSAAGALTPVTGAPFLSSGTDANVVLLSPDNTKLFTSDQLDNNVTSFSVAADGSLTKIGAYGTPASLHVPTGLVTDAVGRYLFIADDTYGLAVFTINGDGSLAPLNDNGTIPGQEMQSVAVYPGRSCASADLGLSMTADSSTVESGSNVTYTISITNNGTADAGAVISDVLPVGASFVSCSASGTGVCSGNFNNPHTITFSAIAGGTTETVSLVAQTSTNLLNGAVLVNSAAITNRSVIDSNPANDAASASITITATPGPTTLSLSPAAGPFAGTAALTATLLKQVNGVGISGKPIAFTVNGNSVGSATTNLAGQAILNVNLAGMALGPYPVTASFAGDTIFQGSSTAGTLTVGKALLTVQPGSLTRAYGDPNPASYAYVMTGFLNSDTTSVVSGSAVCTTTATQTSPVGIYPVTCDISGLSAANYVFTVLPGTLTITPAPLTIKADNQTRIYGDPNPVLTGTITGLKNSDVITANYTTQATPASPVGTYPIVPSVVPSAAAANYTITLIDGTLTITRASLTVNVNDASRFYGDPNPPFSGTLVGLRNGDGITGIYSTTATQLSPVGSYPITAALLDPNVKLGNYTVTINNGTLTIVPAPLTVTVASASRVYGSPNPVLTGTISGLKNADVITATFSTTAVVGSPVGNYPITAALVDPAGKLANYAVSIIPGVLTITPAPLTVAINNASRAYGANNPTLNGSITGLKNGDSITATYSTAATAASVVGSYSITPNFNDPGNKLGNYTVTISGGVLTITPAPLTVIAVGGSRLYGDPNPAATIAGLVNGDAISVTYTSPTAVSPVGTYTLNPVLVDPAGKLPNYAVTIKSATLIINKAPLTVTASNATRVYGSANPVFSGTISGIKNGDNLTPNPTTAATPSTNVGNAVIAAGVNDPAGVLGNYAVTATNGTLTITPAPLTITANNQTIILGGTVAPSASYSGFVLGQTSANLSGTLSCSATKGTGNVGSSAINCSGQSSTNYSIAFAPGTATVIYQVAGVSCTAGPGHVILSPIANTTAFTKASTPTIPVQFRVCDVKGASIGSAGVVSSFVLTSVNGVSASTPAPQGGPFSFVGGTLANGAGSAGWQFNLSTSNLAAGNTYGYQINLNDGTNITFQIQLQ